MNRARPAGEPWHFNGALMTLSMHQTRVLLITRLEGDRRNVTTGVPHNMAVMPHEPDPPAPERVLDPVDRIQRCCSA